MNASEFNELVAVLWGDDWRRGLDDLLRKYGYRFHRQTFYNWQKGKRDVTEPIALILAKEAKRKAKKEKSPC